MSQVGNVRLADDNGVTPLGAAAQAGNHAMINRLIDLGADPNVAFLGRDEGEFFTL